MPEFTRFTETITKKQDKRVVNITVKPTVIDCTGSVWFTDLMLQEGDKVTGFVINTEKLLEKYDGDDAKAGKRFYNGIVRSAATCVIFNLGTTAAGLDYKVYPIQAMAAGDSKHPITVADKKSARIYVEFQEMQDGGDAL
jgi:hypothetical protein